MISANPWSKSIVPDQRNAIDIGAFNASIDINFTLDSRSISNDVKPLGSDEIDDLIQQYGPKLLLHQNEEYFLDSAQSFLDSRELILVTALVKGENNYDTLNISKKWPVNFFTTSQNLTDGVQYAEEQSATRISTTMIPISDIG